MMRTLSWLTTTILALACVPTLAQEPPRPVDYASSRNWLCLPGRADPCSRALDTVALNANGYGSVGRVQPAELPVPEVDCFYVYPTVSRDPGMNSDLEMGPEEQAAAYAQFTRFSTVCRPFAPKYRQATLASLAATFAGTDPTPIMALAYSDVRDAWRSYLKDHNPGRPFVLMGHSQGTIHLTRLIAEEIEGKQPAGRMLSAILLGFTVEVPEGRTVGGTFKQTPLCTKRGQTGCVISYMSFRATNPPPQGSLFGRAVRPGMTAACTNPAALGGGAAGLDSYWFAGASAQQGEQSVVWSSQGLPSTSFVRTEGLVRAACVNRGPVGYLSLLENADPADFRTDRVPGDIYLGGRPAPDWGMHRADMSVAQGDLISLVEAQAEAFRR